MTHLGKALNQAQWGARNNPDAEPNICRLPTAWGDHRDPIVNVTIPKSTQGRSFRSANCARRRSSPIRSSRILGSVQFEESSCTPRCSQ